MAAADLRAIEDGLRAALELKVRFKKIMAQVAATQFAPRNESDGVLPSFAGRGRRQSMRCAQDKALVTGAALDIGAATVRILARKGASVLVTCIGILAIVGTIAAAAAETDVSKCTAREWQDAFNKGDARAVAALYTPNAIEVTPEGIRTGRAAVQELIEETLKAGEKDLVINVTKCEIDGALRWSSGAWKSQMTQGPFSGFWTVIEVKSGNSWKIQNLTFNVTPPPQK